MLSIEDELCRVWAEPAMPPPAYTVSEWADAKRVLPESSAASGARWRTADVPYLRGIMDAARDPLIRKIALMKSAQVGGSEAINNIVGYHIEHDPCPTLIIFPTDTDAEGYSKDRLGDMIRTTPALAAVVTDERPPRGERRAASTLRLKMFPGGWVKLGGAHTENSFARVSARLAIGDDVDRWPAVVGEEGDPADLLERRTTSFDDAKIILVSTPALTDGRIHSAFKASDQRRFHIQCPQCLRWDWITWSDRKHFHVVYDDRRPETARIECPPPVNGGCGCHINEATRRRLVASGEWRATAKPVDPSFVGFHLPGMITTLGTATLDAWVADWLVKQARGHEALKVFVNTVLGEPWTDRPIEAEPHAMMKRREQYGDGIEVPERGVFLTAGVDVQVDRFELQVQAWGEYDERWVVDWRVIPGDPRQPATRAALADALGRTYHHVSGIDLAIRATCVDTGWATDEMYQFVLSQRGLGRVVFATKGVAGRGGTRIVGKPSKPDGAKRPVELYLVNVDDAKADVQDAMLKERPQDGGPSVMHVPMADFIDEDFFSQVFAERRVTKYNKLRVATHQEWMNIRVRNEALDTAVLCLAAIRIPAVRPNIAQERARIETLAAASRADAPVAASVNRPPDAATAPIVHANAPLSRRRVVRSRYLGG